MNTYVPTIKLHPILTLCHICTRSRLKTKSIADMTEAPRVFHSPPHSSPSSSEVTITMTPVGIIPYVCVCTLLLHIYVSINTIWHYSVGFYILNINCSILHFSLGSPLNNSIAMYFFTFLLMNIQVISFLSFLLPRQWCNEFWYLPPGGTREKSSLELVFAMMAHTSNLAATCLYTRLRIIMVLHFFFFFVFNLNVKNCRKTSIA